MLLLAHVTGNPNTRQAALAFHEAGWLAECHHTLAWASLPSWTTNLPNQLQALLKCRLTTHLPPYVLHTHPWPEIARLSTRNIKFPFIGTWLRNRFSIEVINRHFDLAVSRHIALSTNFKAVYGYFDSSLETFRAARRLGVRTIYELPTPYWKRVANICESERDRLPSWADTLPSHESLSSTAAQRDEELQLADLIIVPSHFVRDSLALAPPFKAPVIVLPYGCPEPTGNNPALNRELQPSGARQPAKGCPKSEVGGPWQTANREPLKLLFAGTLSQSKGIADLLEAVAPLGALVELTLAGSPIGPLSPLLRQPLPNVRLLGQLPHDRLMEEMHRHDVLVLPTLYEGLSLTLLEAMAAGLPVITTISSGLSGLVKPGNEAILLQPSCPEALRNCLQSILNLPDQLISMQSAALAWAKQHSWTRYRNDLRKALAESFNWHH